MATKKQTKRKKKTIRGLQQKRRARRRKIAGFSDKKMTKQMVLGAGVITGLKFGAAKMKDKVDPSLVAGGGGLFVGFLMKNLMIVGSGIDNLLDYGIEKFGAGIGISGDDIYTRASIANNLDKMLEKRASMEKYIPSGGQKMLQLYTDESQYRSIGQFASKEMEDFRY